jgi:hypothetical protein
MSLRQFIPPSYLPTFTHRPGTKIYLAGASYVIEVYPTALRLYACHASELECVKEISFPEFGPLSGWVVFIDSIRQTLQVEGRGRQGFIRYRIYSTSDGLFLKPSSCMMKVAVDGFGTDVQKGAAIVLSAGAGTPPRFPTPRLLLGCNKAPNWDRISDRPTMEEVLSLWYQLSSPNEEISLRPSSTLFGAVVEAVQKKDATTIISAFETFFGAAVDGFFVPKRYDDLFLGHKDPLLPNEMSLSQIHSSLCSMIRSLFLREEGGAVEILPCLPKELSSGRLLHETLLSGYQINVEWRKGQVRRVLLHATHDGMVTMKAHAATASIRLLSGGARKKVFAIGEGVEVQEGKNYLLDNFSS